MIRVTGNAMKSEIANAIHEYNGAIIYAYYDELLPFEDWYQVDSKEYSIRDFCENIETDIKEQVKENEGLPLNMIVIYTNELNYDSLEKWCTDCEYNGYVGTVVLMSK